MPSRYAIAAEFDVALKTGARILSELAGRGIIYRAPGKGHYITPEDGEAAEPQLSARVRQALLNRIAAGELKPQDRVPARAQVAAEFGVSMRTAGRVYTELARKGFHQARPVEPLLPLGWIRRGPGQY